MTMESVLIRFLILMSTLFFLPKIIFRYTKIPYPLTEILLGITLGIAFPSYFFADDIINVLATLGIITLFVYAGIEVDPKFVRKNARFFIENAVRHVIVFVIIAIGVQKYFGLTTIESMIFSTAMTTPSASYILSSFNKETKSERHWITNKAISGEILSLMILVILLTADNLLAMIISVCVLALLIFILPHIFKIVYEKMFSKLVGTEFSFIFVVALISAYITEFMGIHFLIGAFVAGFVTRVFVNDLVERKEYRHVTHIKGNAILESFGYFASTFIPFYFFSVGLNLDTNHITPTNVLIAISLAVVVSAVIVLSFGIHRWWRMNESFTKAMSMGSRILPTLVFTFVIATILKREFDISDSLFAVLMFYGIFTSIFGLVLPKIIGKYHHKNRQ